MPLGDAALAAATVALRDPAVVARYPGIEALIGTNEQCESRIATLCQGFDVASLGIAGAERELGVIAHRFAHALVYGAAALNAVPVLGHGCDFSPRLRRLSQRLDRQERVLTARAECVGCFW